MITHNGKQVTLAMRNRKAINLIARNGKAIFGEFSAISFAARAVILAEYGKQVWSDVKQYAKAHPAIVPFINQEPLIAKLLAEHSTFGDWIIRYGISQWATPRLAIDADDAKQERMWLIRPEHNYTDWMNLDNVFTHDNFEYVQGGITPTNNYVSKVGDTRFANGTIVKFFIPRTMPTGYSEWFADGMDIYINGTRVINTTAYHNNRKDVTFDFSNVIKLNEVNYIVLRWWGSGNHGFDFGFLG